MDTISTTYTDTTAAADTTPTSSWWGRALRGVATTGFTVWTLLAAKKVVGGFIATSTEEAVEQAMKEYSSRKMPDLVNLQVTATAAAEATESMRDILRAEVEAKAEERKAIEAHTAQLGRHDVELADHTAQLGRHDVELASLRKSISELEGASEFGTTLEQRLTEVERAIAPKKVDPRPHTPPKGAKGAKAAATNVAG